MSFLSLSLTQLCVDLYDIFNRNIVCVSYIQTLSHRQTNNMYIQDFLIQVRKQVFVISKTTNHYVPSRRAGNQYGMFT